MTESEGKRKMLERKKKVRGWGGGGGRGRSRDNVGERKTGSGIRGWRAGGN